MMSLSKSSRSFKKFSGFLFFSGFVSVWWQLQQICFLLPSVGEGVDSVFIFAIK